MVIVITSWKAYPFPIKCSPSRWCVSDNKIFPQYEAIVETPFSSGCKDFSQQARTLPEFPQHIRCIFHDRCRISTCLNL